MIPAITAHHAEITELCRRFHVRRLDLFGSAARETDFGEASDLDLLVEYEPAHTPPSLAEFLAFRDALQTFLGRKVDLTMAGALRNPFLCAAIARTRQTLHGA